MLSVHLHNKPTQDSTGAPTSLYEAIVNELGTQTGIKDEGHLPWKDIYHRFVGMRQSLTECLLMDALVNGFAGSYRTFRVLNSSKYSVNSSYAPVQHMGTCHVSSKRVLVISLLRQHQSQHVPAQFQSHASQQPYRIIAQVMNMTTFNRAATMATAIPVQTPATSSTPFKKVSPSRPPSLPTLFSPTQQHQTLAEEFAVQLPLLTVQVHVEAPTCLACSEHVIMWGCGGSM
jgi:hypothetical protein